MNHCLKIKILQIKSKVLWAPNGQYQRAELSAQLCKISEKFRWRVIRIPCWWIPWQSLPRMLPTKPNLVCFMAQKIILFRETGFINALEIKGTIPSANVVCNANELSKPKTSPLQETSRTCWNIRSWLSPDLLGQQPAWNQSPGYGTGTSAEKEGLLERESGIWKTSD